VSIVLLADSASSTPAIDPQVAPSGSSSWYDVDGRIRWWSRSSRVRVLSVTQRLTPTPYHAHAGTAFR
jgi:hypothetical protein